MYVENLEMNNSLKWALFIKVSGQITSNTLWKRGEVFFLRIWRIFLFLRAVVNIPIQTLIIPPDIRSPHSWSLGCLCAIQTSNDSITVHLTENLSSCKVVLQLETLLARSFAGRLFASLVVYFAHCWFHLKKKKKASNKKAVFIIPLAWLRYSLFQGFRTQLSIIYFQLKPVIHYSLFSFHPGKE